MKSACHNYVVKVDNRDRFVAHLDENGIATGVQYTAGHLCDVPCYKRLPLAQRAWGKLMTLPLFPDLADEQVECIIDALRAFNT